MDKKLAGSAGQTGGCDRKSGDAENVYVDIAAVCDEVLGWAKSRL